MRVLLVAANTERVTMLTLPVGLGLVAAATRAAGHDVSVLDLLFAADPTAALRDAIAKQRPEVIGISVRNIDDQCRERPRFLLEQVKSVVETCRATSTAPIVLGGPGYSIFPREVLRELGGDYGVAGEGERAFPALLEALAAGRSTDDLQGVYRPDHEPSVPRALERDLGAFPDWDDSIGRADPEVWVPIQCRRGCPNDCSYCSTARIQGRRIRWRSPRAIGALVARLRDRGFRRFFLVDNSFNIPEALAFDICGELAALRPRVEWRCILYPERVREELVVAMAAAGCVEVALGFESGAPSVLRAMNKRFSPEDIRATAELLARHGIRRGGFLLLGGPGETRETVEQSLAFARDLRLDDLRITIGIRIYPGTPLERRAVEDGQLEPGADLLHPRFYLAPGLDPWIYERVASEGATVR